MEPARKPEANYVFGAMDVMPLVELANEAYELGRQHPASQVVLKKWMRKWVEFVQDHQRTDPPAEALDIKDNQYLKLVKEATAKNVIDKMKDQ